MADWRPSYTNADAIHDGDSRLRPLASAWHATYTDAESGRILRIRARAMRIRDGLACDQLMAEISKRADLDDYLMLALLSRYPLLLYGTAAAETSADGGQTWTEFSLTEATFQELPELFTLEWLEAIIQLNPQRDMSYEALKKSLAALGLPISAPTLSDLPSAATP
jgi:hypothetical protein